MNRTLLISALKAFNIAHDANASNRQLRALFGEHVQSFNASRGQIFLSQNAADPNAPAQIMICDEIGKDPWTGEGISDREIKNLLDAITPTTRQLDFFTNSPGGLVNQGVSIRNILNAWPGRITNTVVGIAASAASWCIPADEVRAYRSSEIFIHQAMAGFTIVGNADEIDSASKEAAEYLRGENLRIANIYADQTECSADEMLTVMRGKDGSGTLLNGQQAFDQGFVDKLIDGEAINRFTPELMTTMKNHLAALNKISALPPQGERKPNENHNPQDHTVNKQAKIALLNKRGITPPADADDAKLDSLLAASNTKREFNISILNDWKVAHDAENATDEALTALVKAGKPAPAPTNVVTIEDLQKRIEKLTEADNAAKNLRITNRVEKLVSDDKIPNNEKIRNQIIARAKNDETVLDEYEALPSKPPGVDPVGAFNTLEVIGEAFNDIQQYVLKNGSGFRAQFLGPQNAAKLSSYTPEQKLKVMQEIGNRAKQVARALSDPKNKAKILAAWNTNTIDAGLQRQVILQEYVEEFAIQLLPLKSFSTLFSDVPLEGTDELDVAFYPLQSVASNSWAAGTGYNAAQNTAVETRKVYIGGSGLTSGASATTGYCKDRLWQMLTYSSYEQTRQPYVNWQKLTQQNANKLGVDVFNQFVSRVLTRANYGAPAAIVAAPLFSADNIAELAEVATGLNWPVSSRQLTLNHTYRTPLLKDSTFKSALAYGSTDPIRKAIIQEAYGFQDINIVPNLANYSPAGEALRGWINHISAALFATAPIMPTEEVRALLTRWDVAIDSQLGANVVYRRFGNTTLDTSNEVVECSFGGGKGVASALQLLAAA